MPRRACCRRASTAASPGGARSATTVYTDWRRGSYWRAVRSVTGATARLGIEADHLTLAAERACREALGAGELVDIAPDMMRLRMVKSPAEIALIREAIRERVREIDVAMAGRDAMELAVADAFPDAEYRDTAIPRHLGLVPVRPQHGWCPQPRHRTAA